MPSLNTPLTKQDFINSRWREVFISNGSNYIAFRNKAQEVQQQGNVREAAVFEILAIVTSDEIEPESNKKDSLPEFLQYLTDEHLNFLAEIANEESHPELQAQIADILWLKRGDFQMARLAIDAYLKPATELEDPNMLFFRLVKIERALRLALSINKYRLEDIVARIEAILDRYQGEDPWCLSARLMELLQDHKLGDFTKYAALAEKVATHAESSHDWYRAREHWKIKAKWHHIEKDYEKERAAQIFTAETYVKEAEYLLNSSSPSYRNASNLMEKALVELRKVGGTKERIEEVHKLRIQYQQKSHQELIHVCGEVDISAEVEQAKEYMKGKKFQDALLALAELISPPQIAHLREQVQLQTQNNNLSDLSSTEITNSMGKIVARQPTDLDQAEEATRFEMYRIAVFYQKFYAEAFIEPARYQINLEHNVEIKDLLPIVSNSLFVPPERQYLFAKGLYAGLTGDFITSTHILIPQIENSVRYQLSQLGVITSGYDKKGIQKEHYLTSTLYPGNYPQIKSIFDEDTLFDLQGLLIQHSSSNLRHEMAHGLINDSRFNDPIMSYLWWMTLRLCCLPILNTQQQSEDSNPWVKFDGIFKDDPLFDDFVEEMAAYRRELDAEVEAYEASLEENQSA